MVSAKGKEKVTDGGGKGKRKSSGGGDEDKTGRKRKSRGVLQFFDDAAYQVDEDEDSSDDSMFDLDDFLEDEFSSEFKVGNEPAKVPHLPFLPKEEEMSEEELERMLEERYKPGAGFVSYMEDGYDHKKPIDRNIYVPSAKDPIIWKVKCMVDVANFGCYVNSISESSYRANVYLCTYVSCLHLLPRLGVRVRSKSSGISEGMWARVKNGKYKGDLGQDKCKRR